ncbi:DUF6086 family protein [Streptomyces sp. NEAU-W12]|uniref:DUF6086 family protein n=1 Tax=Streptomyces sp. NEAU-W12 TaxID=2994668 RepID=UPI00224AB55E|nr:DUF6086 family protein [Streptomyces sp. NEAU-W12]MCX2922302.1 DUF6086 family protein [Streptomyces sp. NEAU-W12]
MSYPYELDDETLWDAGSHSGRLFFSLTQSAAAYLERPSGLIENDRLGGCDVDLPAFRTFAEGLYDAYSRTNSAVLQGLWRGLLVTSLVLLDMAGSSITLSAEHEESLKSEMASFGRSMGAANWRQYSSAVPNPGN